MNPGQFIAKWRPVTLPERAASQEHFIDLCRLLGQPTPAEHDSTGDEYTFEKGVAVTGPASAGSKGEHGFADVWWRGKFAWEYKRKDKYADLTDAYRQLCQYRETLENPPLLVVSDIRRTEIHTNFTGTRKEVHVVLLDDLVQPEQLALLRRLFEAPDSFKPGLTTWKLTESAAAEFAKIADALRQRRHDPHQAAHFLMKCMFCLFAEDVRLLPEKLFSRVLERCQREPDKLVGRLNDLFQRMRDGGDFGPATIERFNGGLFEDGGALPLHSGEIRAMLIAAQFDWGAVEPAIFGTLFERSLDPGKRAQIGAHYTSRDDILLIVEPVVMAPLRREWAAVKAEVERLLTRRRQAAAKAARTRADQAIAKAIETFHDRLATVRILDPACGSGNFLYVAIQQLLDLEKELIVFAGRPEIALGLFPRVRPTQLHGIEINPYAAELAQVVIWIGYLQWMRDNGYVPPRDPILAPLTTVECRDAIVDFAAAGTEVAGTGAAGTGAAGTEAAGTGAAGTGAAGTEACPTSGVGQASLPAPKASLPAPKASLPAPKASLPADQASLPARRGARPATWPEADFIIGNPPFLGSKLFRQNGLDDDYIAALYAAYDLPKTSDLCCYWFEQARRVIARRAALDGGAGTEACPTSGVRQASLPAMPPSPPAGHTSPGRVGQASPPADQASLPTTQSTGRGRRRTTTGRPTHGVRVGLLATQGIRGGDNRTVLERIRQTGDIFMAWSDREWILDGAAVHVSMVGFDDGRETERRLDGHAVSVVNADLSVGVPAAGAGPMNENGNIAFMGVTPSGQFDIEWSKAREWLGMPNPRGTSNADVLRPWVNALDLARRCSGRWIIDFGTEVNKAQAAQFEAPFEHVVKAVAPGRAKYRTGKRAFWCFERPRPDMRAALGPHRRFVATPLVSKHRVFVWLEARTLPANLVIAFARSDDYFFGVLHSSIHELWALRMGTQLEDRPRYTPTTCFETFPLPWPPGQEPAGGVRQASLPASEASLPASEASLPAKARTGTEACPTWGVGQASPPADQASPPAGAGTGTEACPTLPAFNPPNFHGATFDAYRRHLPHWRLEGATYFLTWRLARDQAEMTTEERALVAGALRHFDNERYYLLAWVVMNDHVHALVHPLAGWILSKLTHAWKSYSANQMQRCFGRRGAIWLAESFDRVVRDEYELYQKLYYILNNPFKRWPAIREYAWVGVHAALSDLGPVGTPISEVGQASLPAGQASLPAGQASLLAGVPADPRTGTEACPTWGVGQASLPAPEASPPAPKESPLARSGAGTEACPAAYARIAAAARELHAQRERWLNPPEWIADWGRVIDQRDDFADVPAEARPLLRWSAIMAEAARDPRFKKRTLTHLYNERPTWLRLAHEQLDRAVLAAYALIDPAGGWDENWAEVWIETGAGQPPPAPDPRASPAEQAVVGEVGQASLPAPEASLPAPEASLPAAQPAGAGTGTEACPTVRAARRRAVDQQVLANLLRLNLARAPADGRESEQP